MPDVSNLTEDGHIPAHFDHVAIVSGDRVEQPGTLYRDPHSFPQDIERESRQHRVPTQDQASDKYAVVGMTVAQDKAYQLLPAEYARKTATFYALNAPIYFGDETSITNILGALATNALQPLAAMGLPASSLTGGTFITFKYTSRQGLYVCSASATPAFVACFVERFSSGTPVR